MNNVLTTTHKLAKTKWQQCNKLFIEHVDGDGCVPVPDGPGLGVVYDWDFIKANLVNKTVFGD